jgi:predicted MFS family arabinose efflux permease
VPSRPAPRPLALLPGGVFRQREFRLLWTGESVSQFGSAIALVILPLVAVEALHAGTFYVALLNAAAWLPWVVIGLPAGAWADRTAKRRLMIWCDAASALLFLSIPLAGWLHVLSDAQLLTVALLTGVANVCFTTAYQAYLPIIVDSGSLTEANARLQASKSTAQSAGPGIGGVMAQLFGVMTGMVANAASFVVSAVCLLLINSTEERPVGGKRATRLHEDIAEGLHFLYGDRYLRPLTLYSALVNIPFGGIDAIIVVFMVRTADLTPAVTGVAMSFIGVGGLCGAIIARRLSASLGAGRALIACAVVAGPFALITPLTSAGWAIACVSGYAVCSGGIVAFNVINASFRQAYCPTGMLGRIAATNFTLTYSCVPAGAILGGWLGAQFGNRAALWILAAIMAVSGVPLLLSPLRSNHDLPKRPAAAPGPAIR